MFFKAAINPGHNELLETSCEPRDLGEFIWSNADIDHLH
jgi:hypothetical protein